MKIKVDKRIKGITIAAAALVLIIVVAVMFIIVRYTPAKEKMSGYTYYGIDRNTDKVFCYNRWRTVSGYWNYI